jgi:hypothetical protein
MNVGDTVRVTVRVVEGNRVRNQAFDGTIIAKKHGGINESITVRRISYNVGMREGVSRSLSLYRLRGDASQRQGPQSQTLFPARPRRKAGQGQGALIRAKKRGGSLFFYNLSKKARGDTFFDKKWFSRCGARRAWG